MRLNESAESGWLWKTIGCGGAALAALYLLGLLLGLVLGPYRSIGQGITCQANLMRTTRAMRMYADDYDDRLPVASRWMNRIVSYTDGEARFHCPTVSQPGTRQFGYAMDPAVGGKARSGIADPNAAAMVYDSTDLARSAVDPPSSLPSPGRHIVRGGRGQPARRGDFVGYVSGSVAIKVDRPAEGPAGANEGGASRGSAR